MRDGAIIARSGLEACASVVAAAVDAVAIVGGEGARRFEHALAAGEASRARVLPERGGEAVAVAVGMAAAGARVAFVLSGRDAAGLALPALRELFEARRPALVVVPAHGDERGRAAPEGPYDDLALLFEGPVGVLVAAGVRDVVDMTLSACALASRTASPWCVAFELALVGCAVGACEAPSREETSAWWSDAPVDLASPWFTATDLAWSWISARRPALAPVTGNVTPGSEARLQLGGGDFDAAGPCVAVRQRRPFPSEYVAMRARGASRIAVREPEPDAFGYSFEGGLTTLVRAALSGAATKVSELGGGRLADTAYGTARVLVAWNEPARGAIVRALVAFAAGVGWRVRAEQHEPWAASVVVQVPAADPMSPHDVVIASPDALGLLSVLRGVDDDDLEVRPGTVMLLGRCAPERLEEIRKTCEYVGATLRHEVDATLAV